MIEFLSLKEANAVLEDELVAAAARVVRSGWYVLGAEVEAFEAEFAAYCGVAHCVGVGNGLDALAIVLRARGIGPGDEVIVPGNTQIATWMAVSSVGASPVPVDPRIDTYNIDPERAAAAITPRTRAIIAVHLYGQPADMERLRAMVGERDIALIEDAAQAHGAAYRGRRAGSLGTAGCFSFYPTKNLGALGDGGAITTDDTRLAERCRSIRNYGSSSKNVHDSLGINSRLDELQAAVLRVKLKHLDAQNAHRSTLAARYLANLAGCGIMLPAVIDGVVPAWHLFVVRHPRRAAALKEMAARGVACAVHYPRAPHRQAAYASSPWPDLRMSERLESEVFSLPLAAYHSVDDIDAVSSVLAESLGAIGSR
jgi:dTDP-4-amino-4,6-dideoxygalactose transaminase